MTDPSTRLYDLGREDLATRFDPAVNLVRNRFLPDKHLPHDSLRYAVCLLREGRTDEAEAIVSAALALQELRPDDPHRGNFWWHLEDGVVIDLNACQFVLEALLALPLPDLTPGFRERVLAAMRLALEEAERLDVHWTYTNIYLLDAHNRILAGEFLGDVAIQQNGINRLGLWADNARRTGAPHEFNSPTYAAVQLNCLAGIAQHSSDSTARELALEMEALVWRHVARYWHAPTLQLSGPHSRAYRRDVVGASGFLKVALYKLLGDERLLAKCAYYEGHDAEGHLIVANTEYHCPSDAEEMLRITPDRTFSETVTLNPPIEATATLKPTYTLGTMSRPYGVGDPPESWPMNNSCLAYWQREGTPSHGALYCRFRVSAAPPGELSPHAKPTWLDMWEEGLFRTAQSGSTAIVAYGLAPRGTRPVSSLRLDIRLLGPALKALTLPDGRSWDGETNALSPGPIVISDGAVHIGVIPLVATNLGREAEVVLWRDGQETVISIVNYQGPTKMFWEYRSLSGPFWKGNLSNGFAFHIADSSEISPGDFAEELSATGLSDDTEGSVRRVTFGDGEDAVQLAYDLREMWP